MVALTLQVENARAEQLETNIALRVDKVTTNAIIQGRNYTTIHYYYLFHCKLLPLSLCHYIRLFCTSKKLSFL